MALSSSSAQRSRHQDHFVEWKDLIRASPLARHMELVTWLKSDHGVGHALASPWQRPGIAPHPVLLRAGEFSRARSRCRVSAPSASWVRNRTSGERS
ncbi:DUF4287 domain-containing protein [Streptomyces sp. ISL-36]|nr:DUF4287 domain-containing protein [Streptomyces sp. ISL-36]